MFELAQVSKRFGPLTALDGCDLSIAPGHTTVLIGPSGCGKSTLLRILIGLEAPDDGEVRFDGARVDPEQLPALRQRMGYVIQDGGLFPHLSARDNIALMARYLGWGAERVEAKLGELADLTHFPESALDQLWTTVSRGRGTTVVAVAGPSDYLDAIEVAAQIGGLSGALPEGGVRNVARRDGLGTTLLAAAERLGCTPRHYFQAVGSGTGGMSLRFHS